MPFATIQIDLEIIIPSEVRNTLYDITYLWNLKYDTNEQTDSQALRTDL